MPRFPLDFDAVPPPATRGRLRLQLVADASEPSVRTAPAMHDLVSDRDDEQSAALTHIYVPVTYDPPRDLESQRRLDDFWRAQPMPLPEPPPVFAPLFPREPLFLRRRVLLAALLGAAAAAAVTVWVVIFALLASTMGGGAETDESASESDTIGSSASP